MSQKLNKININIAGRIYPVKVTTTEEHKARTVEKQINTEIQALQKSYPSMDVRDCLGMAMIKMVFEAQEDALPSGTLDKALEIQDLLSTVD